MLDEFGRITNSVLTEYGRRNIGGLTEFGRRLKLAISVVITNSVSNLAKTSATLNGTLVDDGGSVCVCGFEWGETPSLGTVTSPQNKVTSETITQGISALLPGRTYYFRAFATSSWGTTYGVTLHFTTLSVAQDASVLTQPATDITMHSANLQGAVLADGGHWGFTRFQWGLTSTYGAETPWVGGFVAGDSFEDAIEGLTEGMGYHFKAQFKDFDGGVVNGKDMVFYTPFPLGPVTLIPDDLTYLLEESI